jgi:hypothetical protein
MVAHEKNDRRKTRRTTAGPRLLKKDMIISLHRVMRVN